SLWRMNNGTPTFVPIVSATTNWQVQGTGDFNGDGTTDIFWRDSSNGSHSMWQMNANTPTYLPVISATTNWEVAA
ncbi:MAG: FG-GAP repeat domain-containing protein, partial [Microcoleus sp.]